MDNKTLLQKGLKFTLFSLPLMFLGPSVIHNALINRDKGIHYLILIIGIILCMLAVFLMFKGISIMVKSIFNDNK